MFYKKGMRPSQYPSKIIGRVGELTALKSLASKLI
jgi:hypothetical protein